MSESTRPCGQKTSHDAHNWCFCPGVKFTPLASQHGGRLDTMDDPYTKKTGRAEAVPPKPRQPSPEDGYWHTVTEGEHAVSPLPHSRGTLTPDGMIYEVLVPWTAEQREAISRMGDS